MNTAMMLPVAIIPRIIIPILTTLLFMALPSDLDSVFGILSGIMVSSDLTTGDTIRITGDIHPITGDTIPIIGVEATIPIMGAAAILPIVLTTDPISGKAS
jgi:hypothetical protein